MNTEPRWRPKLLLTGNLIALLLFTTWLLEPTRSLWLALDEQVFWAANRSLADGELWQKIWAIANNRAFDLVAAASMILLYAHFVLFRDRANLRRYIAIGILMSISILVIVKSGKWIPIERPSGTFIYPEALRLSDLLPSFYPKDASDDSFPGDHGLVLLICAGFIAFYLPRTYAVFALLFTVIFTIPRLMSGAHWLSDELVGAIGWGSLGLSWILATPLQGIAVGWLEKMIGKFKKTKGSDNPLAAS